MSQAASVPLECYFYLFLPAILFPYTVAQKYIYYVILCFFFHFCTLNLHYIVHLMLHLLLFSQSFVTQGANGAMSALFDRYNFSVLTYIYMLRLYTFLATLYIGHNVTCRILFSL